MIKLYNDDCLKVLKQMAENGEQVDLILNDPPYGITECEWDKVLPFETLEPLLHKVLKPAGRLIVFGNQPFYAKFLTDMTSTKRWKYSQELIWEKENSSNPLMANQQLMRVHELAMVLNKVCNTSADNPTAKYFFEIKNKYLKDKKASEIAETLQCNKNMVSHYFSTKTQFVLMPKKIYDNFKNFVKKEFGDELKNYDEIKSQLGSNVLTYNPYTKIPTTRKDKDKACTLKHAGSASKVGSSGFMNYPRSVFKCNREQNSKHPTRKPVAICEHLIKMFSNEGETVLDFTMGSGSAGVAAVKNNRNFIGIELNKQYFETAKKDIYEVEEQVALQQIMEIANGNTNKK